MLLTKKGKEQQVNQYEDSNKAASNREIARELHVSDTLVARWRGKENFESKKRKRKTKITPEIKQF